MHQFKIQNAEELVRLRSEGWTIRALSNHFGVTTRTVSKSLRRLCSAGVDRDARRVLPDLQRLARDVPDGFCRQELCRLIERIRRRAQATPDENRQRILRSLDSGARELEEVSEDCDFDLAETARLLAELIDAKLVTRLPRGGRRNSGRRQKYYYFPTNDSP